MHAQNNQIVALIRTLYSAHQALDLVLDQARARVAAATAPKPVVPRDVIQYSNLLSGQTSAPAFPPNPRMRPAKLAAFPDEAAMLSGALMHQDAPLELVGVGVDGGVPDTAGVGMVPIAAAVGQVATPGGKGGADGGVVDYDTASVPVTENVSTSMASLSGFGDLEDLMDEDGALDLDL
ncbi:hypothetical protein AMAG_05626 [Allomyces macrogynus ATCC 38327]|uniref:Mediator of RNA polymerase II transcription subunit 4 n=1 Tax=Allomyces macrogynus (strain ATCC 38327) TaxID=578462 RepID=A0A0L0SCU1_ALLM3|nr:hypothetical protein AMAG_05626 [Allomyces macrogynus ATCC 38327]|eukprot:KNE60210.1 hypothetical protein AMAG_05626 [Allomyces macrogynus ATCC 38327]